MRILVTGSKGFIGQRLLPALHGHTIIEVDKKEGKDIILYPIIPDIDVVYHLAGQTDVQASIRYPFDDAMNNVLSAIRVAVDYPNAKIINTGTAASLDVRSPYGLSKKTALDYLQLLHTNAVNCILPNIFGEGSRGVIEKIIASDSFVVNGDGKQTREYVHVNDIVQGLMQAQNWKAGEYRLGSGISSSVESLMLASQKKFVYGPSLQGEIYESIVGNLTPDWKPEINPLKYIQERCKDSHKDGV